jgi:hypothetical protein
MVNERTTLTKDHPHPSSLRYTAPFGWDSNPERRLVGALLIATLGDAR